MTDEKKPRSRFDALAEELDDRPKPAAPVVNIVVEIRQPEPPMYHLSTPAGIFPIRSLSTRRTTTDIRMSGQWWEAAHFIDDYEFEIEQKMNLDYGALQGPFGSVAIICMYDGQMARVEVYVIEIIRQMSASGMFVRVKARSPTDTYGVY